jgi:hypothetical protein
MGYWLNIFKSIDIPTPKGYTIYIFIPCVTGNILDMALGINPTP